MCLSLHLSKCHIVGNHMSRLTSGIYIHWEERAPRLLCGASGGLNESP